MAVREIQIRPGPIEPLRSGNLTPLLNVRRTSKILVLTLLASLLLWVSAASVYQMSRPHFGTVTIHFPGQAAYQVDYPFHQTKLPTSRFVLTQNIELPWLYPTLFAFYPEDALWAIKVNGHPLPSKSLPLSVVHHEGRSINLAPYLHPGANQIECEMEVYWKEASLKLYVSPWDKCSVLLSILIILAGLLTARFFCALLNLSLTRSEAVILSGGFLLRYLYVLGTPYHIRAYDWWGHGPYLDYMAQHLWMPGPRTGWENYQPPLYYALVGGLTRLLSLCGMAADQRFTVWQAISLVISTGVLMAGVWIARLLFQHEIKFRLYILTVFAVAPPLVFDSSRVSNDVLVHLLAFLWFGLLLSFWKHHNSRTWFGLSIILGLSLITKATTLVFIPVSLLCLILLPYFPRRRKGRLALILAIVTIGMAGWYYVPRAFHEKGVDSFIIGNIGILNPKAHIDGIFLKSFVFNPFKILRYPFVQVWGPRHEFFLEYFFKSMFLGDWNLGDAYRWLARAFMVPPLLLIPTFLWGIRRSATTRTGNDVPLLITFLAVFLAQWIFIQVAPFLCHQDFRFSVVLLAPIIYFVLRGAAGLPQKWEQRFHFGLQLLMLNCVIYLLELALES